jgi:hypothetical protein
LKNFTIIALLFVLIALPLQAADYSFDVELDENGYYNDGSDLGYTVTISEGSINADANVKVFSDGKVHFEGRVAAGQKFPIGTRTKFLNLEVSNGKANSTVTCTVAWKLAKTDEVFTATMATNNKGQAKYRSSIDNGSVKINSFMASHNCNLKIKVDGQCAFSQQVDCGKAYSVDAPVNSSMEVIVKDAAKNKSLNIAMNISMIEETLIFGAQEEEDQDIVNMLGEGELYNVKFDTKTDDIGSVETDPYTLNPQGVNPQIRLLIADQKFSDVLVTINGIKFRPEFALTFNGRHFYRMEFGLKSGSEVALALMASGGKPQCLANFALVCENTQE